MPINNKCLSLIEEFVINNDPDAIKKWDIKAFKNSLVDMIFQIHGNVLDFDNNLVTMLCMEADMYIRAHCEFLKNPVLYISTNAGDKPNPVIKVRDTAMKNMLLCYTRLGLDPSTRGAKVGKSATAKQKTSLLGVNSVWDDEHATQ